jgi:hypothetical protein
MLRQNGWNYDQIPLDFDGVRRPDQILEQRAQLEETVVAMNELPERQRSALVMRELEGRSYEEIGIALGANDGAVRQLLNRARVTLRTAATALMPPPLVERLATAPPDGRRIAEITAGLGAAGMAKASATALVAGTLVVGALNAPLTAEHGNTTRQKATLSASGPATKVTASAPPASTPIASRSRAARPVAGSKSRGVAPHVVSTLPAVVVKHTSRSGSGQSGSGEHTGSRHQSGAGDDDHSGSGDTSHSGSGDTSHSGSDDSQERSSESSGSGFGDELSREADSSPDSGSDHSGTSSPSDELPALSGSGTSGSSGTSSPDGGGSGESPEPDAPPAATP